MDLTYVPVARGFVHLAAVVDWFSRRVLSGRVSIGMEAAFRVEALEEALARHGRPEIFNTDSENDGVGGLSATGSHQAADCLRIADAARCPSRPDLNTDRLGSVSFPGPVGRLSHQAARLRLADAGDPRRA